MADPIGEARQPAPPVQGADEVFGFGRRRPSPREVAFFHEGDDVDQHDGAHHHTLGRKRGQAARGTDLAALEKRVDEIEEQAEGALPAGSIIAWTASVIPDGWLECNGQVVSRVTYSDLFAIIGTQYGVGDGSTTFNVPDLRGRVVVGLDSSDSDFDGFGKTGGAKTHVLSIAEMPRHNHSQPYISSSGGDQAGSNRWRVAAGATMVSDPNLMAAVGGGQAHNNLQPYGVARYIIKGVGGVGALSSTVESVLLGRVADLEQRTEDTGWVPLVLRSGSTATPGLEPRIRKVGPQVFVEGRFTQSGLEGFTLPEGFRPSRTMRLPAMTGASGSTPIVLVVGSDGHAYTAIGNTINLGHSWLI